MAGAVIYRDALPMEFMRKVAANDDHDPGERPKDIADSLTDGALDTLGCVIRTMGSASFPLANETDPDLFIEQCDDFARHVENGGAVPCADIDPSSDGHREWSKVRRFFIDRRKHEKDFVTERLQDYRGFVDDLVSGLQQIGPRDQDTARSVQESLDTIECAVATGALPEIKAALDKSIRSVSETFAQQELAYEQQISELNDRMSNLRQDLVSVREEMKQDNLTQVFNRGAFDKAITQSLNTHFILKQPVVVVLLDVDHFKNINDQWGHSAGDEVLRSIGECLERSFIRKNDLVSRYGGDEFAVILTDTSAAQAEPLIKRFFDYVGSIVVPAAPPETSVTCSAGYTEISSTDTVKILLDRVDKALYQSKAAGRDVATFAPTEGK